MSDIGGIIIVIYLVVFVIMAITSIFSAKRLHNEEKIPYSTLFRPINIVMFTIFAFLMFLGLFNNNGVFSGKWWLGLLLMGAWTIPAYFINKKRADRATQLTFIQLSLWRGYISVNFPKSKKFSTKNIKKKSENANNRSIGKIEIIISSF